MNNSAPLQMPRWEWRTFAPSLAELRTLRPATPIAKWGEVHEISFLCPQSLHDVVICGDVIRLKWRKQVGPGGLELWDLILTADFPCSADVIRRLFNVWGLPSPGLQRTEYSKAQFLEEVVPQNPDVRAVAVDKRSETFILDGVTCELVELTADCVKVESFCAEHEDPELTLQVVHRLGLRPQENTSYPQGLKTALHIPSQH